MTILTLSLAVLAATPDASQITAPPDLRSNTRGVDAVAFDPAAPALAHGFELQYRQRLVTGEDTAGRIGAYADLPMGPLALFGGYEWLEIPGSRHRRGTIGLATRIGRRFAIGLSYHGFSYPAPRYQALSGTGVWDVGIFGIPASWLSISLGINSFNSPRFGRTVQRPRFVGGLSVRPVLGAPWLTVGAQTSLQAPDNTHRYDLGPIRVLLDVAPLEGLHVLAAYDHTPSSLTAAGSNNDALWAGLSVNFGPGALRLAGVMTDSAHSSTLSDVSVAATLRAHPAENLLRPTGRTVEVAVTGDLRGRGRGLFGRKKAIPTLVLQLDHLTRDVSVGKVILDIGDLDVGVASVDELRAAIARLRKAGKNVVADLIGGGDKAYMVAAAADKIRLDPATTLSINGFSVTRAYFADTLAKIGVRFDAVAIGRYKTAPDALTRAAPRPESDEVQKALVARAYDSLTTALAQDRHLSPARIQDIIGRGMIPAHEALELGLVDALSAPEDPKAVPKLPPSGESVRSTYHPSRRWGPRPVIAVVPVVGVIVSSAGDNPLPGPSVVAADVISRLEAARRNPNVVGVVLRVDSPGGDVQAADLIWRAVRRLEAQKPVVVSMGDVAASGGYYVSAPADMIFAEPDTVTGSIGIFAVKPDLSQLYQWIGVHTKIYKQGDHADWESTTHPLRDADRKALQHSLETYYDTFVAKVAAGRKMTVAKVRSIAAGRVYTGERAFHLGLVDRIGTLADAVRAVRQRAHLAADADVAVHVPEQPLSLRGLLRMASGGGPHIAVVELPQAHPPHRGARQTALGVDALALRGRSVSPRSHTLGPTRIGAEVLVEIAKARQTGILTWSESGVGCEVMFRQGRPELAIFGGNQQMTQRTQVTGVVRGFAVLVSGECEFSPDSDVIGGNLHIDTLGEVLLALMNELRPKQLDAILRARGGSDVAATASFDKLAAAVAKLGEVTLHAPLPNTALGALVAGTEVATQRAWLSLLMLGGLTVTKQAQSSLVQRSRAPARATSASPAPMTQASPSPAAAAAQPAAADPEVSKLTAEIRTTHARWQSQTHYEVLGVPRGAGAETIRKAYFQLAKRWHSDRFADRGLDPEVAALAEELFRRCEEANRVLSNPEERKSYDFVLERQAQGLPTDPKVIMEAEGLFRKAQTLVRRGQAAAAEPLMRQAVELNKGEAEFWVYLGYAAYSAQGHGAVSEARQAIKKGLQMNAKLDSAHEFLGRIARVEGELAVAEKELKEALRLNPKNVDAQRELRVLTLRANKRDAAAGKSIGGLLNKVFKR